jgi:hypothetical protein
MVSLEELRALSNPAPVDSSSAAVSSKPKLPFRGDLVDARHAGRRVSRGDTGLGINGIGLDNRTRKEGDIDDDDLYASMGVDVGIGNPDSDDDSNIVDATSDGDKYGGNDGNNDEDARNNGQEEEVDAEEAQAAARLRAADDREERQAFAVASQKVRRCPLSRLSVTSASPPTPNEDKDHARLLMRPKRNMQCIGLSIL